MESKEKNYYFEESEEFFQSLYEEKDLDEEVKDNTKWVSQR